MQIHLISDILQLVRYTGDFPENAWNYIRVTSMFSFRTCNKISFWVIILYVTAWYTWWMVWFYSKPYCSVLSIISLDYYIVYILYQTCWDGTVLWSVLHCWNNWFDFHSHTKNACRSKQWTKIWCLKWWKTTWS